ncbi:substrate-binding protein domain-containing protein, partial [Prosthecobacter debontii]
MKLTSRFLKSLLALAALTSTSTLRAEETVKVGVLHSLSGTMAISETSLRDI